MKIVEVKKLDDGVSGITTEGRIIRVLKPRESQYGCSQFIVVKDDTGEMGSNINIENEEAKYQGGEYIQVKGKVSRYVKGGKPNISLNGNVLNEIVRDEDVSQEKPISQPITQPISQPTQKTMKKTTQKEYTNNDYWYDKTLREIENNKCIVRECAIKAVSEQVARNNPFAINDKTMFFGFADEIIDYIYDEGKITSEAITKEFGGTATEVKEETKEERIAKAKEIANPNLITEKQKGMIEKMLKSRYIKKEELEKISGEESESLEEARTKALENINKITKVNANRYISYWFGDGVKVGERAGREIAAQEKEAKQNPFITGREPIEKRDPNDSASLTKDLLIEKINKLRKENSLEDDTKFKKELGYNTNFEKWTEKELINLKEKLEIWKPNWVRE